MAKSKQKKKKANRKARKQPRSSVPPTEAEKLTVAWTLTVLTSLGTQLMALVVAIVQAFTAESVKLVLLQQLLLLAAGVAGLLSLPLLPLVLRTSKVPPPRSILIAGFVIAISPIMILLWMLSRP